MKLILEPTGQFVRTEELPLHPDGKSRARVWRGVTGSGLPVVVFIASVRVDSTLDSGELEQELRECPAPTEPISLRHIL